jgi:hypothetical protein
VWILLMFSFAGVENKGLSIYPFIGAAILRDILLITLVVKVIREIQRPATDLIRMAGDDDPSGGVFENAPDRFVLPSLPKLLRGSNQPGKAEAGTEPVGVGGASTADHPFQPV